MIVMTVIIIVIATILTNIPRSRHSKFSIPRSRTNIIMITIAISITMSSVYTPKSMFNNIAIRVTIVIIMVVVPHTNTWKSSDSVTKIMIHNLSLEGVYWTGQLQRNHPLRACMYTRSHPSYINVVIYCSAN